MFDCSLHFSTEHSIPGRRRWPHSPGGTWARLRRLIRPEWRRRTRRAIVLIAVEVVRRLKLWRRKRGRCRWPTRWPDQKGAVWLDVGIKSCQNLADCGPGFESTSMLFQFIFTLWCRGRDWPKFLKSSPHFWYSCPSNSQNSFYFKSDVYKKSPKSPSIWASFSR